MKALVYHGPGPQGLGGRPEPSSCDPGDAIVRVDAITICGTDLHILKGDVPEVDRRPDPRPRGRRHGRGGRRRRSRPSSRATGCSCRASPPAARCRFCREGTLRPVPGRRRLDPRPPDRRHPGRVRPRAVRRHLHSTRCPPASPTRRPLLLADILPDRLRGRRAQRPRRARATPSPSSAPGRSGWPPSSPPSSSARRTSWPSTWRAAGSTRPSSSAPTSSLTTGAKTRWRGRRGLTDGLGADVAIEAVGVPATFELCTDTGPPRRPRRQHRRARQAGHAAPRGPVDQGRHHHHRPRRHLLDARRCCHAGRRPDSTPTPFVTHRFGLDEMMDAYDVFAGAAETGALKVALFRS